jgi:hypothetical protein
MSAKERTHLSSAALGGHDVEDTFEAFTQQATDFADGNLTLVIPGVA